MKLIHRVGALSTVRGVFPSWHFYVLIIALGYWFLLETNYIGGYFLPPDMYRDFLVARNIALHGQWVWLGPWNGVFDSFASPLYNYILALPLLFSARLVVLSILNIAWQLVGALFLYVTGKKLFSTTTGVVAVLLYVAQRSVLQQGLWVFQPFVMIPFLYAAYACLSIAYRDKKFGFLLFAGALIAVAGAVHNSALTMLPVFFVAGYVIVRQNGWGLSRFFIFCELSIAVLVAAYLPAFVASYSLGLSPVHTIMHTVNASAREYIYACWHLLGIVTNINASLLSDDPQSSIFQGWLATGLAFAVFLTILGFFVSRRVTKEHKYSVLFLFGFIIAPIVCAAVLGVSMYARRFLLILGPFSLVIAAVFRLGFLSRARVRLLACACLVLLMYASLYQPVDFIFVPGGRVDRVTEPAVEESIVSDVLSIKEQAFIDDFSFFQIYVYPNTPQVNSWSNARFWLGVERILGQRVPGRTFNFTHNDDSEFGLGYRVTNSDAYVFVVCASYIIDPLAPQECLKKYEIEHQQFSFVKTTYSSQNYSVFLMKKLL